MNDFQRTGTPQQGNSPRIGDKKPPTNKKQSKLTLNVSVTDTEVFKEFVSLSLWMFRRLPKLHKEFAYKELNKIMNGQLNLSEFEKLLNNE